MNAVPPRSRLRHAAFAASAVLALTLSACSTPPAAPAQSQSGAKPAAPAASKLSEVRLDWATYSPTSLVLKSKGWAEEAFKADGIDVKWVQSAGSNKANEFVRSNAVDFGSTAGAAALLERANGTPLKSVYIYEQPEWTALVVPKDSPIKDVKELKGKKVAATKGTDPYFFLLRTLSTNGLSQSDVEIVNVQHADGRTAMERGNVDAWAGLDPHMAASEIEAGSTLLYRNRDWNTYGTLNTREDFLQQNPEVTRKVIELYERSRKWTIDNQEEAAKILADESQISLAVAKRELFERMNLQHDPIPGETQTKLFAEVLPIMKAEQLFAPNTDPDKALATLFDATIAKQVVTK